MKIKKGNITLASDIKIAKSIFSRTVGLIGRKALSEEQGLYFPNCRSIHMWFMSIPIDVAFLSESESQGFLRIDHIFKSLRPWKLLPVQSFSSRHALEMKSGWFLEKGIQEGDIICID